MKSNFKFSDLNGGDLLQIFYGVIFALFLASGCAPIAKSVPKPQQDLSPQEELTADQMAQAVPVLSARIRCGEYEKTIDVIRVRIELAEKELVLRISPNDSHDNYGNQDGDIADNYQPIEITRLDPPR